MFKLVLGNSLQQTMLNNSLIPCIVIPLIFRKAVWRNCKTVFSFLYLSWSQHTRWLVRTVCWRPKIATARFCSWRLEPSGGLWGPGGSKKRTSLLSHCSSYNKTSDRCVCTDLQHSKPAVKANNLSKWGSIFLVDMRGSRFSQYLLVPASFEFLSS